MKKHMRSLRSFGAVVFLVTLFANPGFGHVGPGDALQLFGYYADVVPAPINGDITPDGQEEKWASAYVRSVIFASQDGSATRNGTILVASDDDYLYLAVGFNSQSASNSNWATVYFDQNHDHALEGTTAVPGEYYVKLTGSGPSITENGGYFGTNGWQSYGAVFPPGLVAVADKHGTGNPQTWNFEFMIPLQGGPGPSGESFLNVASESEIGILVQVFDASDGSMYWSSTGRDALDPSSWGEIDLGVRGPERELAASITLGHDPSIDGNISTDPNWQHYTTWKRQVLFTNFAGSSIAGTIYAKSNTSDMYLGLILKDIPAAAGDQLGVYLDYNTGTGGDADFRLTPSSEDGAIINYTGGGTGTGDDTHFENTPAWSLDGIADGEGAVTHNGNDYEFEMRIPLAGTGTEDLQVLLGTRLGLNLEFIELSSGDSYWWNVSTNSRHQQLRVDAASYTALGWTRMQTGAPVIQPIFPKDSDEVSGHFPFMIYATSATGEAGIVLAEFSYDLGESWIAMERADEMGFWTKTWDTTTLPDGALEIRIRVEDSTGLENRVVLHIMIDNSSGQAKDKPVVTITSPDAGAYINGTANVTFTATPANIQTILSTEISIDGGAWMTAASPYAWDTTPLDDGSHIIKVRALQSDSLIGYSDTRLVMVDNTHPEMEAMGVSYPGEQQAAKAGDVIMVTALVRDQGAGLDPSTIMLSSVDVDGASHLMVDDGTNGDAVAGDNLYSYAVTVTSTATGPVTVSMTAQDILGNASPAISAAVVLDNTIPAHVSTVSGDADVVYKNTDVIKLTTTWDGMGYPVTADFGAVDNHYIPGAEQVVDNGDGTYTITYEISFENTTADATGLQIPVTAYDTAGNGPVTYSAFTVELDNTVPAFSSVDANQDSYQDGDTVILTAVLDDSTYTVSCDFSKIDSDYTAGDEMVTRAGNTYTITYTISADAVNTIPDGSYSITVQAEDVAGNIASSSTSFILDNNPPEVEDMEIAYPGEQQAAKAGDVIVVTALVRDKGAGLDPSTVMLNSVDVDGASHLMVDDGTNGDAVAGDHLFSYAVTVTSTVTGQVTVSMTAQDILGNASAAISATVVLDNTDPAHVSTVSGDADVIYKNTDVIKLTTTWDGMGYPVTANFGAVDNHYIPGAEQVVDNEDGTYTITYEISFENATADATGLQIPITAYDTAGNGPVTYSAFTVELDNTAPFFSSVDTDQDNYRDGDTVVVTAVLDDSTYTVWSDFSNIDSNYLAGDETVTQAGNTYTITYTISEDTQNTIPDGSYSITVHAEDVAGNTASASTSIELDNTGEAVTIIRPENGDILSGDVEIDVVSADDTRFIRFQISPDDGANWYNLDGTQTPFDYTEDNDPTDGWTQIWHTDQDALADGMTYRIRVTAYDEMNPVPHVIGQDEVGQGLIVDNTAPSLQVFVTPLPSDGPLSGDVYVPEIVLTGTYFDLPDSAGVTSIIIEHRNADGGHINDSPIHIPVVDRNFSQMLRLVEAGNYIQVTAIDRVGQSISINVYLNYVIPEGAYAIGPEGGIVQSPDGTTVIIPAGALQKTVNIAITSIPKDELPPTKDPQLTLLKRAHHFSPEGLVFHKQVDIVLPYTEADLDRDQNGIPDWDEQDMNVFFYDDDEWLMTDQPDRDPINNTLTLHVNHFSTFDIGVLSSGTNNRGNAYWTKNPFKPEEGTTCVFKMVEDGVLSLKIYDLSGHLVRTIADRERITATSSLRWDGMNDFDRFVGTGVYIYLMEFTGDSGQTVRIRKPLGVVK